MRQGMATLLFFCSQLPIPHNTVSEVGSCQSPSLEHLDQQMARQYWLQSLTHAHEPERTAISNTLRNHMKSFPIFLVLFSFILWVFVCTSEMHHRCAWCLWRPEKGNYFLGTEVLGCCMLSNVGAGNLSPLQELQTLLTATQSIQLQFPKVFLIALKFTKSHENHIYAAVN